MKKMKKMLVGILAVVLTLSMTGCSASEDISYFLSRKFAPKPVEFEVPSSMKMVPKEEPAEGSDEDKGYKTTEIDPIILLDENDVKIWLVGMGTCSMGYTLRLRTYNGTDRQLYFLADAVAINGLDVYTQFVTSPAPGEEQEEYVYILDDVKNLFGFEEFGELSFNFRMTDYETDEIVFLPEQVSVKLPGTANTVKPYVPEGTTVFDEDGVKVIVADTATEQVDKLGGMLGSDESDSVLFQYYVSNDSEKSIFAETDGQILLNGQPELPSIGTIILPGHKKVLTRATISKKNLKAAGIDEIKDVTQSFIISNIDDVYDMNVDWVEIARTEPVTVPVHLKEGILPEKKIITENDDLSCTINAIKRVDFSNDYVIDYTMENHSDEELSVDIAELYVNGRKVCGDELILGTNLKPGESGSDRLRIKEEDLEVNGIGEFCSVTARLGTIRPDDAILTENYRYTPFGTIDLSGGSAENEPAPEGTLLLDEEGVRVTLLSFGMTESNATSGYPCVNLYVENESGRDFVIRNAEETVVDGKTKKKKDDLDYGSFLLAVPDGMAGEEDFRVTRGYSGSGFEIHELQFRLELADLADDTAVTKLTPVKLMFE